MGQFKMHILILLLREPTETGFYFWANLASKIGPLFRFSFACVHILEFRMSYTLQHA